MGAWQLVQRKVSRTAISDWTRTGFLYRELPGVYALGHPGRSIEAGHAAALLYAGQAIAVHEPRLARTRSRLERKFLALCERYGIPLPEVNVRIGQDVVDALWREQRLVVELDGYGNHHTRAQIERDHGRDLRLRALGLSVLRYTESQVDHKADRVAADVLRQLSAG